MCHLCTQPSNPFNHPTNRPSILLSIQPIIQSSNQSPFTNHQSPMNWAVRLPRHLDLWKMLKACTMSVHRLVVFWPRGLLLLYNWLFYITTVYTYCQYDRAMFALVLRLLHTFCRWLSLAICGTKNTGDKYKIGLVEISTWWDILASKSDSMGNLIYKSN